VEEDRPLSIRARKKVKAQIEKTERDRLMLLFTKRMELARKGTLSFKEGKLVDAVLNYTAYIEVLEKTKGIGKGGLEPKHFDRKKDIAELLLVCGVFWDLAKMYDRPKKKDNDKLKHYLDRFVLFSKGMPFQKISTEMVRKYLVNSLPKNRTEFKDAHVKLGGGKCFIATAVEDDCAPETLPILRKFRSDVLMMNFAGRAFVKVYYRVGPPCAQCVLRMPKNFQKFLARRFDWLAGKIDARKKNLIF
jgi:hypothetical protein